MNLRFIDWIWRVRGSVPIDPPQSNADAFDRLDSLFQQPNTTYRVQGDTLTFTKKAQLPQDKMSVFDSGTLKIADGKLWYDMMSRALLACFIAPLFFYTAGTLGVKFDAWRNPPEVVKAKAEAAKRRSVVKPESVPMNPIDEFLGAPKPEKKKPGAKGGEEIGKRNRKPSMTTAYVFMGIFFALWILGRILEQKLINKRFRRKLAGEDALAASDGVASPFAGSANA